MSVVNWTHEQIPAWDISSQAWVDNAEQIDKDNEMWGSIPWADVAPKGETDLIRNARIYRDIDTGQRMVKGLMKPSVALAQGMAQDYTRGWLAPNMAHDKFAANMMLGGTSDNFNDTILSFNPEDEAFLLKKAEQSPWNITKIKDIPLVPGEGAGGSMPIFDLWDQTPEDLFLRPPPKDWNVDSALEVLSTHDPSLYYQYTKSLGGEDTLKDIVKDARNPYEFFYRLSEAAQLNALGQSIQVWQEQASNREIATEWAKAFVIQGIANDPDLVATTAASIGLATFTAGTSLLGGAALWASRVGKAAKRLDRIGDMLAASASWIRQGNRYLPENLGPTLVKNHLFKNKYAKWGKIKQYGVNRIADTAEGLITEPLAEIFNQKRQISYGHRDTFGWGEIALEGGMGALISGPGHLNFIVGHVYGGVGRVAGMAGLPLSMAAQKMGEKGMLSSLKNWGRKTLRYADPEYTRKVFQLNRTSDHIKETLREGIDPTAVEAHREIIASTRTIDRGFGFTDKFKTKAEKYNVSEDLIKNAEAAKVAWIEEFAGRSVAEEAVKKAIYDKGVEDAPDLVEGGLQENWYDAKIQALSDKHIELATEAANNHDWDSGDLEIIVDAMDTLNKTEGISIGKFETLKFKSREEFDKAIEKRKQGATAGADDIIDIDEFDANIVENTTGDPIQDELFNILINTIYEHGTLGEVEFLKALSQAVDLLKTSAGDDWGKLSPMEAAALLTKSIVEFFGQSFQNNEDGRPRTTLARILSEQQYQFWIYQKAKAKNMTYAEYIADIVKRDALFEILPDSLQEAVKKAMGKDFETADNDTRLKKAAEIGKKDLEDAEERLGESLKSLQEKLDEAENVAKEVESMAHDKPDEDAPKTEPSNPLEAVDDMSKRLGKAAKNASETKGTLEAEARQSESKPPPKNKDKREKKEKREKRLKTKIKTLEGALETIETLQRELETELEGFLVSKDMSPKAIKLHRALTLLKKNVDRAEKAYNEEGAYAIHKLKKNNLIFGTEVEKLFIDLLDETENDPAVPRGIRLNTLGKRRIQTKDLSDAAKTALKDIIDELNPKDKLTISLQKILDGTTENLTVATLQSLLNRVDAIADKKAKVLMKSAAAAEYNKWIAKFNDDLGAYQIELAKLNKSFALEERRVFDTIHLLQYTSTWQKEKLRALEGKKIALIAAIKEWTEAGKSTVTLEEFLPLLHAMSPLRESIEANLAIQSEKEKKKILNKTYTIAEVQRINDQQYQKTTNIIKTFRPGLSERSMFPMRSSYLKRKYSDQVSDDSVLAIDYSTDYILNNSTPGTPLKAIQEAPSTEQLYTSVELADMKKKELESIAKDMGLQEKLGITKTALTKKKKAELVDLIIQEQEASTDTKIEFTRSLQNDVKAWTSFEAALISESGGKRVGNEEGVAAWRILACMPDYFWDMGLGLHVVFHSAIQEGQHQEGISSLNPVELGSKVHLLRFRMEDVISIVSLWKSKALAQLQGWQREGVNNVLDSLEQDLMKEGDPSSGHNLMQTITFLDMLQGSLKPFQNDMFEMKGYVIELDTDTGFPTKHIDPNLDRAEQDHQWKRAVRRAVEERIKYYLESNQKNYIKNIGERFGINVRNDNWRKVALELGEAIVTRIHEVDPSLSITGLGDGTLGWDSSDHVGMGLVDFLSGRPMPGVQPMTAIGDRTNYNTTIGSKSHLESGTPVQVILPVEGDINHAMPIPIWKLGEIVNDFKHRARVAYHLNKENYTKEEIDNLDLWIKNKTTDEGVDPTGREFPVFLFPQFVGGHLKGKPLNRNEMKDLAIELMLDIPRVASSFIHDQVRMAEGMPVSFRNVKGEIKVIDGVDGDKVITRTVNAATYQPLLTHGDDFVVPFNRIGEIMAVEAMSPLYARLTEASIYAQQRYAANHRAIWQAKNPKEKWDITKSFDTINESDRNASGYFELKLLSLANDETSTITVEVDGKEKKVRPPELIMMLRDGVIDHHFGSKDSDDFYLKTGHHIIKRLFETGAIDRLGAHWKEAFELALPFKDAKEWKIGIQQAKDNGDMKLYAKLNALRDMFKVNTMRRIYGGGRKNFDAEFIEQPQGEGKKALNKIQAAFGWTFSSDEINNYGDALFTFGTVELNKTLIDEALGLNQKLKNQAISYLTIERQDQAVLNAWKEILKAQKMIDGKTEAEVTKKSKELLSSHDTHLKVLDAQIDQIAAYEGLSREAVLKKRKYKKRFNDGKEFLKKHFESHTELIPGSDEYELYTKLLIPSDHLSARDIGYFRALNIMNSSAYRLNVKRIQETADIFKFKNFDARDFLGLENHVFFHLHLPTATSYRSYDALSAAGMNPQGMALERVATTGEIEIGGVVYKGFHDYMDQRKKMIEGDGGVWGEDTFRQELEEFLTVDTAADRFGMHDLTENALKGKTREELESEIDTMLTRHLMMAWSAESRPPKSVFPDYTLEDNPRLLINQTMQLMYNNSENRHETLKEEMREEEKAWEGKGVDSEILKIRAKSGGIVNEEIALRSEGAFAFRPYHTRERRSLDKKDKTRSLVVVDTSNPKGPRAMLPKFKTVPFHDKGILALQRIALQEKLNEILHPLDRVRGHAKTESHGMIAWDGTKSKGIELGWVSPWNKKSLPEIRPVIADEFELSKDPINFQTGQLWRSMKSWAAERGLEEQLDSDPHSYPYFYIVREMERVRNNMIKRGPRILNDDEEMAYRNRFIENLHMITQLSRDVLDGDVRGRSLEERSNRLAISRPPREDESWMDILTSIASKNNPDGILVQPTLLHQALKFGQVGAENMFISIDGEDVTGSFDFSELKLIARAVQMHDFQKYLASILYQEYIGVVLKTYKQYQRKVDGKPIWKHPEFWETKIDPDPAHRTEIINKAKALITDESESIVFDISLVEHIYDDVENINKYRIVFNQPISSSDNAASHELRYAGAGEIGGGMLIGGTTGLKGKNAKLGISPAAALNMFAMLENSRAFLRIGESAILNKRIGVTTSSDGRAIKAQPIQDTMKEALGHNIRTKREDAIHLSERLQRIAGDTKLEFIKDETSGILGRQVNMVNLHHYLNPQHKGGEDLSTAWVESFISPVLKIVTEIENAGFSNMDPYYSQLKSHINQARLGSKIDLAIIMHLTLLLENPKDLDFNSRLRNSFFDVGEFDSDTHTTAFETASSLFRRLVTVSSEKKYLRDMPFYWQARNFVFDGNRFDDPELQFRQTLADSGQLRAFDDFIRARMGEENPAYKIEITDEELAAERHIWADRAYRIALGEELDTVVVEEVLAGRSVLTQERGRGKTIDIDITKSSRTYETMAKLAEKIDIQDHSGASDISRVNRNIESMVKRGFIDAKQARLIRAIAMRAYVINPELFADFEFQFGEDVRGGVGAFKQGTKFFVRIGSQLKELGKDKLNIVQIVAHELSHIARLKFIEDNGGDWFKFEAIYNSTEGRSFVRKLVKAWHNGKWTDKAEAEYQNYLNDPEEFIAALGQFYLLKDILPEIRDLNAQESSVLDRAKRLLENIFAGIERIFAKLGSVWSVYSLEHPDLMGEVDALMDRLFGWDRKNSKTLEIQKDNADAELNWQNRHAEKEAVKYKYDDADYRLMVLRVEDLKNSKSDLTDMELMEMAQLDEILDADGGTDTSYNMYGQTRREYFKYLESGLKSFGRKNHRGEIVLDFEKINSSSSEHTDVFAQDQEAASALHFLTNQMHLSIGNQIQRGGGKAAANIAKFLSTLGGFRDQAHSEDIRNTAVDLTTGSTGAGRTWNSGHIIPIWMTHLLNDQIVTMAGHYTNTAGTPSVSRMLEELSIYSQRVMASYSTIEGIMHPISKIIKGEGKITEAQAAKLMNPLNTQIALKAENPSHEFEFDGPLLAALNRLSEKKRNLVISSMNTIATTFQEYLKKHTDDGIKLGVYGKAFRGTMPYKFSTTLSEPAKLSTLRDELGTIIHKNIIEEGSDGRIDGLTFYQAGFIPMLNAAEGLISGFEKLKAEEPDYYNWLVNFIIETNDVDGILNEGEKKSAIATFLIKLQDPSTRENAIRNTRVAMRKLFEDLARGNITWKSLGTMKNKRRLYEKYMDAANHVVDEGSTNERFEALFGKGIHHYIPQYVAFNPRHTTKPISKVTKNSAVNIHVSNLINRAGTGQYIPNDNWIIPKLEEAVKNPRIREHLILHPVTIVEDFRRGIADEIGEKMMMAENYKVFATYRDVITLYKRVILNSPRALKNYDGTNASKKTVDEMVESADVLLEKHDFIRGINNKMASASKFEQHLMSLAPSFTKIAFGGNLALATATVEGMMNIFQEGLGKGNLKAAMRGIFNPILALNENQREEVVNDLIHLVGSLTQGHIPEYEKPAQHVVDGAVTKFVKGWGNQMMRPAQMMMKNIAITRAMSVRSFITKNIRNEKLRNLVTLIEDKPLIDPDDLAARMREVGLSPYAHEMTISYLLRGGFLDPAKYQILEQMVLDSDETYSPFIMANKLSEEESLTRDPFTSPDYANKMDVIAGLKVIERAYIEEVIVTPNAFDISTRGGVMDTLFEIFLRYPILFVSQHVFRKGSRLHPARYAFGLMGMMFLDMLYMNLLKIAAGNKIEDVLKDWEENPVANSAHYFARFPILGRYLGIITQMAFNLASNQYGQQAGGFVALGAFTNIFSGGKRMAESHWNDAEHKWQDTVNFMRIFPVLGDTIMRMGLYLAAGDNIERRRYRSAAGRGGGGGRSRQPVSGAGHFGVAYRDMYGGYEHNLASLVRELTPETALDWPYYNQQEQVNTLPWSSPMPAQQTPTMPSEPVEQPVAAPKTEDVVGSLSDANKPREAPEELTREIA